MNKIILIVAYIAGVLGTTNFIPMEKIQDNLGKAEETDVPTFFYRRMKNYHSPENEKVLGLRWELLLTDENYVYYGQRTSKKGNLGVKKIYKVRKSDVEGELPCYISCEEFYISQIVVNFLDSIEPSIKNIRKMKIKLGQNYIIVDVKYVTLLGVKRKDEILLDKKTLFIKNEQQ